MGVGWLPYMCPSRTAASRRRLDEECASRANSDALFILSFIEKMHNLKFQSIFTVFSVRLRAKRSPASWEQTEGTREAQNIV